MTRNILKSSVVAAGVLGLGAAACGQIVTVSDPVWDAFCKPLKLSGSQYSNDYNSFLLENDLFGCAVGLAGTVNYGKCADNFSENVRGRIGFTIGSRGSIQDEVDDQGNLIPNSSGIDNEMRLTPGMPISPGATFGYAMIVQNDANNTRELFGNQAFSTYFVGASNRYMFLETTASGCSVKLQVDLVADGARLSWTLQSTGGTALKRALWFGQYVNMLLKDYTLNPAYYVTVPGRRPLQVDTLFDLTSDPTGFPNYIRFGMTQALPYGLEVELGPNDTTVDASGSNSDQTQASQLLVGKAPHLLNGWFSNTATMPGILIPDTLFVNDGFIDTGYIQKFPYKDIPPNTVAEESIAPQFVAYYKSTTGVSNYALPYAAVVDAPHLIQVDPNSPTTFITNPSRLRVYIDNVGGFGSIYKEIPLEGVKVTLSLPDGMFEYNTAEADPLHPQNPNRTITKIIDSIAARTIGYVDFLFGTNQNAFGELGYTVKIQPAVTIASKTLNGSITVASQPRLLIRGTEGGITGANLVSPPWAFTSTNWETILSGSGVTMRQDQDFRAFTWDAKLQAYIPSTGPQRELGYWILSKKDLGYFNLGGNPAQPADTKTGAPLLELYSGWNLIGNPYNYAFPLAQINGVSGAIGTKTNTFQELVDQGIVSGSLAYWDQDTQTYKFIDVTQNVQPNRGYWLYVATPQELTLSFPPVYQPYLRSAAPNTQWVQSDKHWRLQLVARGQKALDDQNYVGLVQTTTDVQRTRMAKPPIAPIDGAVSLSIKGDMNGKTMPLASAFTNKTGKQQWDLSVTSKDAGQVTVTWPNLSTVPKNLKLRLVDVASGATRDMRRTSGYSFTTTEANTTREFQVQVEPGTVSSTKIGSVTVTRSGRGPAATAPLSIGYTLTNSASTTIRILGADGREIYVATRGRADDAGTNTVTWNLRDTANRAVPPGTYRVEIVAETQDGERVRRIVPVTVIR